MDQELANQTAEKAKAVLLDALMVRCTPDQAFRIVDGLVQAPIEEFLSLAYETVRARVEKATLVAVCLEEGHVHAEAMYMFNTYCKRCGLFVQFTGTTWYCIDCVRFDDDPQTWCKCNEGDTCRGPCRQRAHQLIFCPYPILMTTKMPKGEE